MEAGKIGSNIVKLLEIGLAAGVVASVALGLSMFVPLALGGGLALLMSLRAYTWLQSKGWPEWVSKAIALLVLASFVALTLAAAAPLLGVACPLAIGSLSSVALGGLGALAFLRGFSMLLDAFSAKKDQRADSGKKDEPEDKAPLLHTE